MSVSRAVWLVALGGAAAFVFFVAGASPSVTWFDGGELVAAGHLLGSSHPPGQPLHALIIKAASFVPFGDIAFRANATSAAAGALAVALCGFLTLRLIGVVAEGASQKWTGTRSIANEASGSSSTGVAAGASLIAVVGALSVEAAFALSPYVVAQAVRVEVYAPQAALALGAALVMSDGTWPLSRRVACAALLTGLGAGMHPPLAAIWAMVLFALLLAHEGRALLTPKRAMLVLASVVLGVAALAYLPLAVRSGGFSWGHPDSAARFFDVVTARAYGANLSGELAELPGRIGDVVQMLCEGTSLPWVLAAAVGVVALSLHRARLGFGLLAAGCAALIPLLMNRVVTAENPDAQGYLLVAIAVVLVAAVVGLASIVTRSSAALVRAVPIALAPALVISGLSSASLPRVDDAPATFAREVLAHLPPYSLALLESDHAAFLTLYAQEVERRRPDVVLGIASLLDSSWVVERIAAARPRIDVPFVDFAGPPAALARLWLERNGARRPIFVEEPHDAVHATAAGGILYRVGGDDFLARAEAGRVRFLRVAEANSDPASISFARRNRLVRCEAAAAAGDFTAALDEVSESRRSGDSVAARVVPRVAAAVAMALPFSIAGSAAIPPRRIGGDFVSHPGEIHRMRGDLLAWLGLPGAEAELLRAVQLGQPDACVDLVALSVAEGAVKRGLDAIDSCVVAHPVHAVRLLQSAAVVFARARLSAEAERAYRQALARLEDVLRRSQTRRSDDRQLAIAILRGLARLRAEAGDRPEATVLLERARDLSGQSGGR